MSHWSMVCREHECPPGQAREVIVDGRVVALFHADGEFYALDGVCPHQGGPLGEGQLQGCVVTCPWHGWQFDVRTGQHQISSQIRHPAYPVKVEGGAVYVDLENTVDS